MKNKNLYKSSIKYGYNIGDIIKIKWSAHNLDSYVIVLGYEPYNSQFDYRMFAMALAGRDPSWSFGRSVTIALPNPRHELIA